MKDGFYYDMPFAEYAAIPAINGSSIVHMRRSPMLYKFLLDNPQPPTPAMVQGTATHRLILEPQRVGDFAVWGEAKGQGRRFGEEWEKFKAAHADKMIVTASERDTMVAQMVALYKNPDARKYLAAPGPTEVSMVWTEPMFGRQFKGRIDKLVPAKHTIVDLKTTCDCTAYGFGRQAGKLGYHIKAAIYWLGYRALTGKDPRFKFVPVESKLPHESAVYNAPKDVISQGLDDLAGLVATLTECEASGTWPAAQQGESDLVLPAWATTEADTELQLSMEGV